MWYVVYHLVYGGDRETVLNIHPFIFRKQMFDKETPIVITFYKELTPEEAEHYFTGR